ncbi:polysaccharide deacetylase family protein [Paenibacillus hamazuiensis]|uniref:polysaccharide deacetylase family protein n=1 Tax=Paenibacillus hamazuiensis TaxID=2936508 RepID=UPI002010B408|nr:polysaccharide deacetylase family protein [Paenibacillus hamazuiensis]
MVNVKLLVASGLFVIVLFGLSGMRDVNTFIDQVKSHTDHMVLSDPYAIALPAVATVEMTGDERDLLLTRIKEGAEQLRKPAINAKLDHVWKAIPGLNGVEVDVEKTFLLAQKHAVPGEIPYVFKEVSPQIGLDDLGAQPIYKGNPQKPMVALMINVAWGNEYLPKMLEVLDKENVHATFFFDGTWLKSNIDVAKDIMARGHEVSNHAYSHKNMSQLSRQKATEEIVKTQNLLSKELGAKNVLFAPPSGDYDQETVNIAHSLGLRTILWTLDTVDWRKPEPWTIVNKIRARVEPGSLILMHPTSSSSEALAEMISIIKEKKLRLGTVSDVISPKRVPES